MSNIKQALFLVGGRGTRLGALTRDTPKPLLAVGGMPFLDHLIRQASRHGFDDILLLAGHLAGAVQVYDGRTVGNARIKVLVEPQEAGTAGALQFARPHLAPRFLMANGDSYFDFNLLALTADEGPPPAARLALRQVEDAGRYGAVQTDGARITAFAEKGTTGPGLINAGLYVLDRSVLDLIDTLPSSIERDVFPRLAERGQVEGRVFAGDFIDIGIPVDFERAQSLLPKLAARPMVFLDRDGVLNRDINYAHRPDQIEWMPGAIRAVRLLNDRGFYVSVVTNQAGIARGLYTEADVIALHDWMNAELRLHGAHVDSWHFCPHHPDFGPKTACICRKPLPGLLGFAADLWRPQLAGSFLVGDKDSDIKAAEAFGVPGYKYTGAEPLDRFVQRIPGGES